MYINPKVIRILLDDATFPELRCEVQSSDSNPIIRTSLYDTATSNFTPMVNNALMFAVRDIIRNRKENSNARNESHDERVQERQTAQRVEERPKGKVSKTGHRHRPVRATKVQAKRKVKRTMGATRDYPKRSHRKN
jgi:hypothetical protein